MNLQEFSNEFDVLYNNIMSNQAPGLDEYEKSVFLTKAQNELVKEYFNPKGNKYQEGFDGSKKRQMDFSSLLEVAQLPELKEAVQKFDSRSFAFGYPEKAWIPINESIEEESSPRKTFQVVPLSYDEYLRLMSKPYKYPLKNQVWRLFNNGAIGKLAPGRIEHTGIDNVHIIVSNNTEKLLRFVLKSAASANASTRAEVTEEDIITTITITLPLNESSASWWNVHLMNTSSPVYEKEVVRISGPWDGIQSSFPAFTPTEEKTYIDIVVPTASKLSSVISEIIGRFESTPIYKVRYIKKPTPIILTNLPIELSIDGVTHSSECILPQEIHSEILQRAVELAKSAYQGDLNSAIEMGKRSE